MSDHPQRHYLIVYDKEDGEITYLERFSDGQDAIRERFAIEREYGVRPSEEIVVLSAASLADLRRTHGRYFLTSAEIAVRLAAAL